MKLIAFRIQNYKCVRDSGWIELEPLTTIVGRNEAGKTSLLRALHKLNPMSDDPYVRAEFPRGFRREFDSDLVVSSARFRLEPEEVAELQEIAQGDLASEVVEVVRDYGNRLEVELSNEVFPGKLHPNDIGRACEKVAAASAACGSEFCRVHGECVQELGRLARDGRFAELEAAVEPHKARLTTALSPADQPQRGEEDAALQRYAAALAQLAKQLKGAKTPQQRAHEYVVQRLPRFIYMDDYRTFTGTAWLDQVNDRAKKNSLTPADQTLLMLFKLSGLELEKQLAQGAANDREERQYDLSDASATLSNEIEGRWRQRKYEVEFEADGHQFFTFVKSGGQRDRIKLEERSRGFQWFFSFDMLFMHESEGTFEGCVLLLDEPGLHLHPEGQRDLLKRLESYAEGNTLIYSTHLPFMIDLRKPERIRVLSESDTGTQVSDNLALAQPQEKLTLQAALGVGASQSYLVGQRNLVVEGVDDFWVVTELSNLCGRSGVDGLDDDVVISAAGGASEAAYLAAFMVGQDLAVAVLLDSDQAGDTAEDKLVKDWLTRYKRTAQVLRLGDAIAHKPAGIEDVFDEQFYVDAVQTVYGQRLPASHRPLALKAGGMLVNRVQAAFADSGVAFNKGSVAKVLRKRLRETKSLDELPPSMKERVTRLMAALRDAV